MLLSHFEINFFTFCYLTSFSQLTRLVQSWPMLMAQVLFKVWIPWYFLQRDWEPSRCWVLSSKKLFCWYLEWQPCHFFAEGIHEIYEIILTLLLYSYVGSFQGSKKYNQKRKNNYQNTPEPFDVDIHFLHLETLKSAFIVMV